MFRIEYQGLLLRFCTHRNEFNCVFTFTKLRKYTIPSLIWSYESPCMWVFFHAFVVIHRLFQNFFQKHYQCRTVWNFGSRSGPIVLIWVQMKVGPDLGTNCLQRSADYKIHHWQLKDPTNLLRAARKIIIIKVTFNR